MQPIPCDIELIFEDPKKKTREIIRKPCMLLGFGTEIVTVEIDGKPRTVNTTVAIVQIVGEGILRRAPIDAIRMPELKLGSNLVIPRGRGN